MSYRTIAVALSICTLTPVAWAAAQSSEAPAPGADQAARAAGALSHLRNSTDWVLQPVRPAVALTGNSDGSASAKANLTLQWDHLPAHSSSPTAWAVVPTMSLTDNTKKSLLSFGTGSGSNVTPGETSFSVGVMGAFTRYAALRQDEVDALIQAVHGAPPLVEPKDVDSCRSTCADNRASDNCPAFRLAISVLEQAPAASTPTPSGTSQPPTKATSGPPAAASASTALSIDRGSLCTAAQKVVTERYDKLFGADSPTVKAIGYREQRFQFPAFDISLWVGGGASAFPYYELQTSGSGTSLPTYDSVTKWQPNEGIAVRLTALPLMNSAVPHGLTLEVFSFFKGAYQASKNTGMGCTGALGTVTSDKLASTSFLEQCGTSQPIGAPSSGADLVAETYVGWADVSHNSGRLALGGGVDRAFGQTMTTWSIKLPLYVNGTASKDDSSSKPSPARTDYLVNFSYDGIVRLTPTVSYTDDPSGKKSGWAFAATVDLIANHNLFPRADSLVK